MRVEKKAFAYRVPIEDYNYLQCTNVCRYPKLLVSREKMHFCQKHCYTLDVSDTSVFDFKGF